MRKLLLSAISSFATFLALTPATWAQQATQSTSEWIFQQFYALFTSFGFTPPPGFLPTMGNIFLYTILPFVLVLVILYDVISALTIFQKGWVKTTVSVVIAMMLIPTQGLSYLIFWLYATGATAFVLLFFFVLFHAMFERAIKDLMRPEYMGFFTKRKIYAISIISWSIIGAIAGASMIGVPGMVFGLLGGGAIGAFFALLAHLRTSEKRRLKKLELERKRVGTEMALLSKEKTDLSVLLGYLEKAMSQIRAVGAIQPGGYTASEPIMNLVRSGLAAKWTGGRSRIVTPELVRTIEETMTSYRRRIDEIDQRIKELQRSEESAETLVIG